MPMVAQLKKIIPRIVRKLRFITGSWEHQSTLSQGMSRQIPFWYSSLKSISILSSHICIGLPVFQSKICSRLPSFPCMPHSLTILQMFFDALISDKQYKLQNSTKCILFCPIPVFSSNIILITLFSKTTSL